MNRLTKGGRLNRRRQTGLSMLELVVTLALSAVLSAYAVPAYVGYTARGHRIDAVIALHRAAQHMAANPPVAGRAAAFPPGLDRAPAQGRAVYRLEWLPAPDGADGYEIQAVPLEGGPMHGDACGTFVLDALGTRSNRGAQALHGAAVQACWAGRSV